MTPRPVLAALVASVALAAGATACSSSGGPTGPAAASPRSIGSVEVDPRSGPVGTMFSLAAKGLTEGDVVDFEITFPGDGKAYPGAALTVAADGTATTTYRATTANRPGDYTVRLTGPPGTLAEGRFSVTDGPPLTTTAPTDGSNLGSSTTFHTGTTARTGRPTTTTLVIGLPSTTTVKPPGTTTTTRHGTSTTATTKATGTAKPVH